MAKNGGLKGWTRRGAEHSAPDMDHVPHTVSRVMRRGTMKGAQNHGSMWQQILLFGSPILLLVLVSGVLVYRDFNRSFGNSNALRERCTVTENGVEYTGSFNITGTRADWVELSMTVKSNGEDVGEGSASREVDERAWMQPAVIVSLTVEVPLADSASLENVSCIVDFVSHRNFIG